ncbi:MAG: hypothetical protein RR361_06340, partial [Anaerovorax sp.]
FREFTVHSYSSENPTTAFHLKITSDVEVFLNECDLPPEAALKKYYFFITGKQAFLKPDKKQGERKARVLQGICDIYNGNIPRAKYSYNKIWCPEYFQNEFIQYGALYLMMLLAGVYGLRSSDIKERRMDAVNWKKRIYGFIGCYQ